MKFHLVSFLFLLSAFPVWADPGYETLMGVVRYKRSVAVPLARVMEEIAAVESSGAAPERIAALQKLLNTVTIFEEQTSRFTGEDPEKLADATLEGYGRLHSLLDSPSPLSRTLGAAALGVLLQTRLRPTAIAASKREALDAALKDTADKSRALYAAAQNANESEEARNYVNGLERMGLSLYPRGQGKGKSAPEESNAGESAPAVETAPEDINQWIHRIAGTDFSGPEGEKLFEGWMQSLNDPALVFPLAEKAQLTILESLADHHDPARSVLAVRLASNVDPQVLIRPTRTRPYSAALFFSLLDRYDGAQGQTKAEIARELERLISPDATNELVTKTPAGERDWPRLLKYTTRVNDLLGGADPFLKKIAAGAGGMLFYRGRFPTEIPDEYSAIKTNQENFQNKLKHLYFPTGVPEEYKSHADAVILALVRTMSTPSGTPSFPEAGPNPFTVPTSSEKPARANAAVPKARTERVRAPRAEKPTTAALIEELLRQATANGGERTPAVLKELREQIESELRYSVQTDRELADAKAALENLFNHSDRRIQRMATSLHQRLDPRSQANRRSRPLSATGYFATLRSYAADPYSKDGKKRRDFLERLSRETTRLVVDSWPQRLSLLAESLRRIADGNAAEKKLAIAAFGLLLNRGHINEDGYQKDISSEDRHQIAEYKKQFEGLVGNLFRSDVPEQYADFKPAIARAIQRIGGMAFPDEKPWDAQSDVFQSRLTIPNPTVSEEETDEEIKAGSPEHPASLQAVTNRPLLDKIQALDRLTDISSLPAQREKLAAEIAADGRRSRNPEEVAEVRALLQSELPEIRSLAADLAKFQDPRLSPKKGNPTYFAVVEGYLDAYRREANPARKEILREQAETLLQKATTYLMEDSSAPSEAQWVRRQALGAKAIAMALDSDPWLKRAGIYLMGGAFAHKALTEIDSAPANVRDQILNDRKVAQRLFRILDLINPPPHAEPILEAMRTAMIRMARLTPPTVTRPTYNPLDDVYTRALVSPDKKIRRQDASEQSAEPEDVRSITLPEIQRGLIALRTHLTNQADEDSPEVLEALRELEKLRQANRLDLTDADVQLVSGLGKELRNRLAHQREKRVKDEYDPKQPDKKLEIKIVMVNNPDPIREYAVRALGMLLAALPKDDPRLATNERIDYRRSLEAQLGEIGSPSLRLATVSAVGRLLYPEARKANFEGAAAIENARQRLERRAQQPYSTEEMSESLKIYADTRRLLQSSISERFLGASRVNENYTGVAKGTAAYFLQAMKRDEAELQALDARQRAFESSAQRIGTLAARILAETKRKPSQSVSALRRTGFAHLLGQLVNEIPGAVGDREAEAAAIALREINPGAIGEHGNFPVFEQWLADALADTKRSPAARAALIETLDQWLPYRLAERPEWLTNSAKIMTALVNAGLENGPETTAEQRRVANAAQQLLAQVGSQALVPPAVQQGLADIIAGRRPEGDDPKSGLRFATPEQGLEFALAVSSRRLRSYVVPDWLKSAPIQTAAFRALQNSPSPAARTSAAEFLAERINTRDLLTDSSFFHQLTQEASRRTVPFELSKATALLLLAKLEAPGDIQVRQNFERGIIDALPEGNIFPQLKEAVIEVFLNKGLRDYEAAAQLEYRLKDPGEPESTRLKILKVFASKATIDAMSRSDRESLYSSLRDAQDSLTKSLNLKDLNLRSGEKNFIYNLAKWLVRQHNPELSEEDFTRHLDRALSKVQPTADFPFPESSAAKSALEICLQKLGRLSL